MLGDLSSRDLGPVKVGAGSRQVLADPCAAPGCTGARVTQAPHRRRECGRRSVVLPFWLKVCAIQVRPGP